jgi:hypothetical protein
MRKGTTASTIKAAQAGLARLQEALEASQSHAPTSDEARLLGSIIKSVWDARVAADNAADAHAHKGEG